ncbi:hypothetical protein AAHC03_05224 [Spirometra sp. Aus1]
MELCADRTFWKACLESFLDALRPEYICDANLLPEALLQSSPVKKKVRECLADDNIRSGFMVLLQKVCAAAQLSSRSISLAHLASLLQFIGGLVSGLRKDLSNFGGLLLTTSKLLSNAVCTLRDSSPSSQPQFLSEVQSTSKVVLRMYGRNPTLCVGVLKNLVSICPQAFLETNMCAALLEFILRLLRPPAAGELSASNAYLPVEALSLFCQLLDKIQQQKIHVENSTYNHLFDVLRAFPGSSDHSDARLFAWWKFLCVLPSPLLEDGFRRFFSPFLANLLGRYVSITAPLGDPQLHRYRLNSGSAYDGNPKALLLAAHVFSSIFKCQELAPDRSVAKPTIPDLEIPASVLTTNAYQFEVALFHWLRLLCGRRPSNVHIDRAWIQCIEYLQSAVTKNCMKQPDPAQTRQVFLRQTAETSVRLVLPRDPNASCGSLISPTVHDSSTCPLPKECVAILRDLVKTIVEKSPSSDFKAELLSTVTFSALNLLSTWHHESVMCFDEEEQRSELELSQLITELLECEPRLQTSRDSLGQMSLSHNGDFVSLSKDLLEVLVPECCRFVTSCSVPEESRDCLPLSNLKLSLGGGTANLPGLRVWMQLADKVSELIASHKRIVELPKTASEGEDEEMVDQRPSADLTTMYALCLAPVFLAGSSTNPSGALPTEEEGKALRTLFTLFRSFHAEACLLTGVPTNNWIDQLGMMISELVQSSLPDPIKKLNVSILSYFLEFMAKTAEAVDEDAGSRFSPSRWLARRDRPLGQMTGLVDAISKCLAFLPLQRTEAFPNSPADIQSGSPKVHMKVADRSPLSLFQGKSPSVLSPNQLLQLVVTFQPSSTDSVALLQALGVIVQRHIYTLEALLCLVERISSSLMTFAVKFSTMPTVPETPSIIAAFEAFTILLWKQLQTYLRKPVSTVSLTDLPVIGVPALKLSPNQAHRIVRFFGPAIVMASLRPKSSLAGSRSGGRKKSQDSASSKRRKRFFLDCLSSLWNLVTESASADSDVLSAELRNILVDYVSPLLQCFPVTGKRLLLPSWIPKDKLGQSAAGPEGENNPPEIATPKRRGRTLKKLRSPRDEHKRDRSPSGAVGTDSDGEDIPLTEFLKRLRRESSSQPTASSQASGDGIVEATQTPPKPKFGSFLQSRRMGTASAPRVGLRRQRSTQKSAESRASGSGRRRLSLVPRQSFEEKQAPRTPIKRSASGTPLDSDVRDEENPPDSTPSKAGDVAHADGHVKRRLFAGEPPITETSPAVEPAILASPPTRKRRLSESDASPAFVVPAAPNLPDFEDSAQFVFIPPTTLPNKKIRLTEHQRERRREQRQAYLPSMYNELDVSQQSTTDFHSDSQSSQDSTFSQSFARFSVLPPKPSLDDRPSSSVAQQTVAESVPVDRTTSDGVMMAIESPTLVPLPPGSEADGADRCDSPPVLCSTVRLVPEALKSPLAVVMPNASIASPPKPQQDSGVILEPFEATQESQVEQMDPIVIAETAGFSQTQEPDSPVELSAEVNKELDTNTGTAPRLVDPAANSVIVNLTPSKSTDLVFKPPAQTPSPSQKKTGDVATTVASSIDFTSPTPSITNRTSLDATRMTSLSPQIFASSASRHSAPSFLTGSPMITPASASAPGLSSPLFRGAVGSRAQKMLALGLKKAAELSKQRASQPPVDSQSSSCDETSLDRRSPLTSPSSVNFDITETGRPGILRDLTTPRSRNRVSFVEHPTIHLLISPDSTVSSEGTSPKKVSLTEAENSPGEEGETNASRAATDLSPSHSQDSQEVSFSPVVLSTHLSSGVPDKSSPATSSLQLSPKTLVDSPPGTAARRRRKTTAPARHPPLDRSSREALRESLQRSPVGTVPRLTKQKGRIRLFAQTSDDEEGEANEESEEVKEIETETSSDLTNPLQAGRLVDNDQPSQVASSPPVVTLQSPPDSYDSKPPTELTSLVEPSEHDEVIAETQELSPPVCLQHEREKTEDEIDVVESSQEQEANELASILAPFTDRPHSPLDIVAKGFNAIPAFICGTEDLEAKEEGQCIEENKTGEIAVGHLKDSCLAASVELVTETEPQCTPTKEEREDVADTSMTLNITLTEVSISRPSPEEAPTTNSPPASAQEDTDQEDRLSRVRSSLQNLANDLPCLPREVHKDILLEALAVLKSIM